MMNSDYRVGECYLAPFKTSEGLARYDPYEYGYYQVTPEEVALLGRMLGGEPPEYGHIFALARGGHPPEATYLEWVSRTERLSVSTAVFREIRAQSRELIGEAPVETELWDKKEAMIPR
jgi:hypothetical protein